MSAVISECGRYRQRLDRVVDLPGGPVYAFFGVNGSTAGPEENDATVRKWVGFTKRLGGFRFIVGNVFDLRAKDVRELARQLPVTFANARHLNEIIAEADVLVPCWGNRAKVPRHLHHHIDALRDLLFASGKPVRVWGFTASGDPLHPLMLGYDTPLVDWTHATGEPA